MSTRSGRARPTLREVSPPRTRKGVSPPRSPARARKTSPPARSPSRKSPSRKSPSRKPTSKFPARKSPSRSTKESADTIAQKSPGKRAAIKSNVTVNLQDVTKLDVYRGTRSKPTVTEYSIKDSAAVTDSDSDKNEKWNGEDSLFDSNSIYGLRNRKAVEEIIPRRSTRIKDYVDIIPDIRRSFSKSVSKSISKSVSQSIDRFSDEEYSDNEVPRKTSKSVTRKLATPLRESINKLSQFSGRWEFGGRIGSAILMLLMPLTMFTILISCTKFCAAKSFLDLTVYKSLSVWFSIETLGIVVGQYVLQALLALTPILGPKVDQGDETGTTFCSNAFFSCIFTVNALFTLSFFNVLNSNTILSEYLKLALLSYLFAVVLGIVLYVKSRKLSDSKLNPYGNTGYALYDFCMGREIHPSIKKLNVKIWITRISNINALILAVLVFKHGFHRPGKGVELETISLESVKDFLSKVQLKPTVILYSMMQIIYILNFIMKERKITSTFFWQSEGLGYFQLVASALYPFYFTTIAKFVADTKLSLSTNSLIAASALYVLGFLLMLIGNNIKHEFRKNPLHPSLANFDSMPTFHGKKLLVSSVWGIVRHPNYAGDILIHIALAVPGISTHQYIAAAPALLTILLLLHRSWRDHSRCRRRYGAAWERYCKRVPKVIIPKIL